MLTGVSKEKAIKALCNGKQVLVCDRSIRNGKVIPMVSLEDYLDGLDFLMDLPAVPNPDFEDAVHNMVIGSEVSPLPADSADQEQIESNVTESDSMEPEREEEVIPPPRAGGSNASGR